MRCARWLFLVLLLVPSMAEAQGARPEPTQLEKQEAAERFERGVQLFREQAYRAAVVEFQRAYDLAPDYRLLYNLGRAKHQLQDYLGAAQDYEAYLEQGGSEVAPERRAQVEETLLALGSRVGRVSIEVNRPGADVFLDDVKVGTAPLPSLVLANVGRHQVSARAPDGAVASERVDVAGGDIAEVTLALAVPPVALGGATSSEPRGSARRSLSRNKKLAVASFVAGGIVLAGSAVTGVMSLRAKDDLDSRVGTLGIERARVEEQRDKVDALSLTTDILIGVGAALAVTGTVIWLVDSDGAERRSAREDAPSTATVGLKVGPGALGLTGRF